ncbi:MAG TPA: HAD family hydrolase [Acidimicrobiales bacterium]|nr:HAD family hydrolase [Acidimicrobiales bacterium]
MSEPPLHLPAPTTWVFDVDGCLIDSLTSTSLRPGARELLVELRQRACTILLWSAGGAEYARERATAHDIADLFDGFHGKDGRDDDGRYRIDALPLGAHGAVFVDDRPEDLPDGIVLVAVSPYLSHTPHDRGLRAALARDPL